MDPLDVIYKASADVVEISEPISVSDFIQTWKTLLTDDEIQLFNCPSLPLQAFPHEESVLSPELAEELFIISNPADSLYSKGTVPGKNPTIHDVPRDVALETVKVNQTIIDTKKNVNKAYVSSKENRFHLSFHAAHRAATVDTMKKHVKSQEGTTSARNWKKGKVAKTELPFADAPDAIVQITVKRPARSYGATGDPVSRGKRSYVIHALASNLLSDVKDAIKCPKDYEVPGDFSLNPAALATTSTARVMFPSSMFFIEDKFYIDPRTLHNKDYSESIRTWLTKRGCKRDLPVLHMHNTKLLDLTVRLGQPYLYMHQGDCEHVIQITDIRLLDEHDCPYKQAYPIQISSTNLSFAICNVCNDRAVGWMVTNSPFSPSDPAHYCDQCFNMLHYDKEGKKIGDFQAFRYTDNDFLANF